MRNVKIVYAPRDESGIDPLNMYTRLGVKAEIRGIECGKTLELNDGIVTNEVVIRILNFILEDLEAFEKMKEAIGDLEDKEN